MIEGESEKEIRQKQSNHTDEEIEIDLMGICLLYTSLSIIEAGENL